jgi:hypothetical protein
MNRRRRCQWASGSGFQTTLGRWRKASLHLLAQDAQDLRQLLAHLLRDLQM